MAATYEPIATTTLATAATSITLSSIPGTYTDLKLVIVATTAANDSFWINLNGTTGTSTLYSNTDLYGTGTSVASSRSTNQPYFNPSGSNIIGTTIPSMYIMDFLNYSNTTTNKTCLINWPGDNNTSGGVVCSVGMYRSTSAITSIKIQNTGSVNFSIGTTVTLYGIKAA